jgi:hypothetical protein
MEGKGPPGLYQAVYNWDGSTMGGLASSHMTEALTYDHHQEQLQANHAAALLQGAKAATPVDTTPKTSPLSEGSWEKYDVNLNNPVNNACFTLGATLLAESTTSTDQPSAHAQVTKTVMGQ